MIVAAKVVHSSDVVEINTYEQLRELDSHSNQLKTDAIQVICQALDVRQDEITDITVLKKGMTNRSFLFSSKGKKYIMRIPGEGTEQLIVPLTERRSAMTSPISIRKMAIRSQNFWKAQESAIRKIRTMWQNA